MSAPWTITKVEPKDGFVLALTFSDGTRGDIDMEPRLWGKVFEPLRKDLRFFRSVYVDTISGAIAWSEDLDYAPDALHDDLMAILSGKPDPAKLAKKRAV